MLEGKFRIEVVTEGCFEDCGFNIKTIVIRLNPDAMNEYIASDLLNSRGTYETAEEWEAYKSKKAAMRQEWESKVLKELSIVPSGSDGLTISQNVSEIFTVVYMSKENKD